MQNEMGTDPNKRRTIMKGNKVTFAYPDHFTNQQTGFTPAGRPGLNFPKINRVTKTVKTRRIRSAMELKMLNLFKDVSNESKKKSRRSAFEILYSLPAVIGNIYFQRKCVGGPGLYF